MLVEGEEEGGEREEEVAMGRCALTVNHLDIGLEIALKNGLRETLMKVVIGGAVVEEEVEEGEKKEENMDLEEGVPG